MPEKKSQYTLLLCSCLWQNHFCVTWTNAFFFQQRISNSFSQAKPPGFVCIFILHCNISIRVRFDSIWMDSARFASFVGNLISQCVSDIHSTRLSNVNRFKYATWESIKWMQIPRQILSDRVIRLVYSSWQNSYQLFSVHKIDVRCSIHIDPDSEFPCGARQVRLSQKCCELKILFVKC